MEHRPCLLAILWVGCLRFVLLLAAVCVFLRVFWYLCASPLVCDGVSCTPGARQDDHKVYCSGESEGSLTTCWTVLVLGLSWVSCRTRKRTLTWPAAFLPASWMHGTLPPASTSALSPLDKKAEIDILAAEYISTVKTLSSEQRVAHLQKIQSAYSKCKEYSDDKVQLAMQTYEMVSRGLSVRAPAPAFQATGGKRSMETCIQGGSLEHPERRHIGGLPLGLLL